jgi:hypothetical protein
MNDAKLTIRLPTADLEFAKSYAKQSGLSLTALISRYLKRLQASTEGEIPAEIKAISGIVPSKVDARNEFQSPNTRGTRKQARPSTGFFRP